MRLPSKTVRIKPHTYKLWYDADACTASGVRGQYLGDEAKVLMDPRLPLEKQVSTVLHEAVHGMMSGSPLSAGKEPQVDSTLEELIATEMERGFLSLLTDNPWLLDLLKKMSDGHPVR